MAGQEPAYLTRLLAERPPPGEADALREALRGDCHAHSNWSDGGSPPEEMAQAARALGHEWMALTDHSPRLTVANGLSAERLEAQLELVSELNATLAPFRILTGIEVDILEDGALDQREDLLARLDMVVASVHSQLRMPAGPMTARMVAAVRNPHVDVLGHCTGRMLGGRTKRPESAFDADAVFGACREHGVAVEINCRPERMDPPDPLLAPGGRGGLPVRHRHRRARAGPARLAGERDGAGREGRHHGGPGHQRPERGRGRGRRAELTRGSGGNDGSRPAAVSR